MVERSFDGNTDFEGGLGSDLGFYDHNLLSTSISRSISRKKGRKEPSTVVVACRQCRSRKVRCDSTRPHCNNCTRRSDACQYDPTPKRRGPDKHPGTRRKPGSSPVDATGSARSIRGTSRDDDRVLPVVERTIAAPLSRTRDNRCTARTVDFESIVRALGLATLAALSRLSPVSSNQRKDSSHVKSSTPQNISSTGPLNFLLWGIIDEMTHDNVGYLLSTLNASARIGEFDALSYIPRGPSVVFSRQTWWDNLLQVYSNEPSQSTKDIFQDLYYVLNNTKYWLSLINMPMFLQDVFDPIQRVSIQPSIVLSALAVSTLMRSSETGMGEKGRRFSLWLRDAAQSSLDASLSTGWIEPSLTQAAFFLLLFEANLHPNHTFSRISSAIFILDSLIRGMGLLLTDVHEPAVSIFPAFEIPVANPKPLAPVVLPTETVFSNQIDCFFDEESGTPRNALISLGLGQGFENDITLTWERLLDQEWHQKNAEIPIGGSFTFVRNHGKAGFDANQRLGQRWAQWPETNNRAEIQKEEIRRVCWSSLLIVTFFREFTPHMNQIGWDLHITRQENYALFFPGEATSRKDSLFTPKETLWAIHCRATLLWNMCQKLEHLSDDRHHKAMLANQAWTEILDMEESLKRHSPERKYFFPGQEYLYQLKVMALNKFSRVVPMSHTSRFSRRQAVDWLIYRSSIVQHARKLARLVKRFGAHATGLALAKRPFSVWWALSQIKAGVTIWRADPSLVVALEQSLEFLSIVDFMIEMWPSPGSHSYHMQVKEELLEACSVAGISPPLKIPIPGLASNATMTITPLFDPSNAADIPVLPPD